MEYISHGWQICQQIEYFCNGVLLWKSFAFEPLSNQPVIHTLRWLCAHFMTYNEPHNNCFMINLKLAQSHKWNQLDWPLISCLLEWNQCCVSIKMCFDQMAQQSNKRKPEINRTEIHLTGTNNVLIWLTASTTCFMANFYSLEKCVTGPRFLMLLCCVPVPGKHDCILEEWLCSLFVFSLEIRNSCGWCGSCAVRWWCGWVVVGWPWMSSWWKMTRAEVMST